MTLKLAKNPKSNQRPPDLAKVVKSLFKSEFGFGFARHWFAFTLFSMKAYVHFHHVKMDKTGKVHSLFASGVKECNKMCLIMVTITCLLSEFMQITSNLHMLTCKVTKRSQTQVLISNALIWLCFAN